MTAPQPPPSDAATAAPLRRHRRLHRAVAYAAFAYAAWCTLLYFAQDRLLFPAAMAPPPLRAAEYDAASSTLTRDVPGVGKVVAWFIPHLGAYKGQPRPLVVFFHGNAELIDYQDATVAGFRNLGCSILLPEYRGYGRSAGRPGEAAIVDDALYFIDQAERRPEVDKARIVLHGRSLGGGPAALVAARRRPAALILESTFTSAASMAHRYLAPEFLCTNPFRIDRVLATLDVPVLILHGAADDIIPVSHGRRLRALARRGTYIEYDCRHNDFPGDGNEERYWRDIAKFLAEAGVLPENRP